MPRTIGLDFGTHQTKVCVEDKTRFETKYTFISFKDNRGIDSYVLPSIIRKNVDGTLSYGYIDDGKHGTIIRYFKQATFTDTTSIWNDSIKPELFTIWYLAYILFNLEDKYDKDFSITIGVPTDYERHTFLKKKAVSLLLSAYRLVEEIYENDINAFLCDNINSLLNKTSILGYSDKMKEEYSVMVFPEAYACLRPLAAKGKAASGLSLMIDIGGGTTDISFFTMIPKGNRTQPVIYELISVPKGLNYLTKAEDKLNTGKLNSNVVSEKEIDEFRMLDFFDTISDACYDLRTELFSLFRKVADEDVTPLASLLKKAPAYYTGGGSTFSILRKEYADFTDIYHITSREWGSMNYNDAETISKLCPILSTVFGLSISTTTDSIERTPLDQVFKNVGEGLRAFRDDKTHKATTNLGRIMEKEYGVLNLGDGGTKSQKSKTPAIVTPVKKTNVSPKKQQKINNVTSKKQNEQARTVVEPQGRKVLSSDIPSKEVYFENLPVNSIDTTGMKSRDVDFHIALCPTITEKCLGKVMIINGYAYDVYFDNKENFVIDALHFDKGRTERRHFIIVSKETPLHSAAKLFGVDSINQIVGNGKKKKNKTNKAVKVTFKAIDLLSKKKVFPTYTLRNKIIPESKVEIPVQNNINRGSASIITNKINIDESISCIPYQKTEIIDRNNRLGFVYKKTAGTTSLSIERKECNTYKNYTTINSGTSLAKAIIEYEGEIVNVYMKNYKRTFVVQLPNKGSEGKLYFSENGNQELY